MAKEIIPCGGFYVDDETLSFDGKILKANGSGGGGGMLVVNVTSIGQEEGGRVPLTFDKSTADICNAFPNVCIVNPLDDAPVAFFPHYGGVFDGEGVAEFYCMLFGNNQITVETIMLGTAWGEGDMAQMQTYTFPSNNEPM